MKPMFFLMAALILGCSKSPGDLPLDKPTSGSIRIAVDESIRPLMDAEVNAFTSIYRNAHIEVQYVSESEAVNLLLTDSVRLVVLTRSLSADEKRIIANDKITPTEVTVAREGIALITNKNNSDTLLALDDLLSIGKGASQIVFDHPNSGIVKYLKDSILHVDRLPENCYALNSNEAVIDYVATNKNAIGLIGASWISDTDDTTTNKFLSGIHVIGIRHGNEYYQPYQAYIAQDLYPLTRDIIVSSREARSGLGSGFMSFVASDRGQRIVLKSGLVPATMPLRIVEINHESF